MLEAIYLPKLNNLQPTLDSTLLKIMEETGELARAVLKFLPYEQLTPLEVLDSPEASGLLREVAGELLDVAQTCVTMIFVMEDLPGAFAVQTDALIDAHVRKLVHKGYCFDNTRPYQIATSGNFKCLALPKLVMEQVTLLTTVCKIQEELGELTQYLGKCTAASGEKSRLQPEAVYGGCAEELLDVAQCCFTMMYILAERYQADMPELVAQHVDKLRRRGYWTQVDLLK